LLEIKNINAAYGFLQVLWDVTLNVADGEFVALVGPNGAGKTTTLRTVAGLLHPSSGDILIGDHSVANMEANRVSSEMGVSYISESLNLFTGMSVEENLLLGAYIIRDQRAIQRGIDSVYSLFPRLAERKDQLAGTLSGGERKMLAIGRGMMSFPKLMLVDEPSLGLAPNLTMDVFHALETLRQEGVTILLVEQNVNTTLKITDRAYVLEQGQIVLSGASADLQKNEHVRSAYLGL